MTNHDEVQDNSAPRQDGPQPSVSNDVLARLADATVYDSDGDKVGSVEQVYIDDKTGRPSWVEVKTGFFGLRDALVPLHDVDLEADQLRVPYSKDVIKDAPRVDADQHISRDEEGELHAYYRSHGWSGGDAGERRSDADECTDDELRGRHAAAGDPSEAPVMQEGSAHGQSQGHSQHEGMDAAGLGVAGMGAAGAAYAGNDHGDGVREHGTDPAPPEYAETFVAQESREGAPTSPNQSFGERSSNPALPERDETFVADEPRGDSSASFGDSTDRSDLGSRGGETPVYEETVVVVETDGQSFVGDRGFGNRRGGEQGLVSGQDSDPGLASGGDRGFGGDRDSNRGFGGDQVGDRGFGGDEGIAGGQAGEQGFADGNAGVGAGGGWQNDGSHTGEDFAADSLVGDASPASSGRRVSEFDEVRDGGYGIGSAAPIHDNAQPMGHPIRAWHDTMSFRGGEERDGEREPDVWFFDEQAAYNAGYHDAD